MRLTTNETRRYPALRVGSRDISHDLRVAKTPWRRCIRFLGHYDGIFYINVPLAVELEDIERKELDGRPDSERLIS
jgi:hypothetical protein